MPNKMLVYFFKRNTCKYIKCLTLDWLMPRDELEIHETHTVLINDSLLITLSTITEVPMLSHLILSESSQENP